MDLSPELVSEKAAEYAAEEALYAVETEQLEGLPGAFAAGEFGWRDAEWVLRWYFRRHLGDFPDDRRRAHEDAFGGNDYEAVSAAIEGAVTGERLDERVAALTALEGVDVPVASAFLQFVDPARLVVVGEREWAALHAAGELAAAYPEPLTVADYDRYLETCRAIADRFGCHLVDLQRALWRLRADR